MNLYELFKVSPSASHREIKKSYRRLLSNDGLSNVEFAKIDEAYATLSDTQLRQLYDSELGEENTASDLLEPLPEDSQFLNPFTLPAPPADTIELVEPLAESTNLLDESTVTEPAAPNTEIYLSSSGPRRARGGRSSTTNSLRTIISCVAAALAAGPIAILLLKFVFDRDPLDLWEVPPRRVVVRQPIDPGNMRVPPPSTELEKPTQPAIPLPQTETVPKPDENISKRERDTRMPVPTDIELAGPLTGLEGIFLGDYEAAKANADSEAQSVALVALAKKLFMNGKLVLIKDAKGAIVNENRIERYAWYQVALTITIESGDTDQVEQICEALSADYQIEDYELRNKITLAQFEYILARAEGRTPQFLDAWKLLFQNALTNLRISIDAGNKIAAAKQLDLTLRILKQLHPTLYPDPNDRKKLNDVLTDLCAECISNSEGLLQNLHFELALDVLNLARSIAIAGSVEQEKASVEMIIAQYAHFPQLAREYEAAKLNLKNSPDDPKINSALAIYTILILDDWNHGLLFLAKGQDTILATIAKTDNQATAAAIARKAPVIFSDEVKLFDQWLELFKPADRDINRKKIILRRTKFWYEQALPDLSPLKKLELEKKIKGLYNELE